MGSKKRHNTHNVNSSKWLVDLIKSRPIDVMHQMNRMLWYSSPAERKRFQSDVLGNSIAGNKVKAISKPKSIDQLCKTQYFANPTVDDNQAVENACFIFKLNVTEINKYINLKKTYEISLISKKYNEAKSVLDEIDETICVSLWSISQRFLICELTLGLEENKKLLSGLSGSANKLNDTVMLVMLDNYSNLAEERISYANYQDNIIKYLNKFEENSMIKKYLNFKFNLEYEVNPDDFIIILQVESQFSIIDLYNSCIEILPMHLYMNTSCCHQFLFHQPLCDINDSRLKNMILYKSNNGSNFIDDEFLTNSANVLQLIEEYTVGNYRIAIEGLSNYLAQNPHDFQMLLMQIKSSIIDHNHNIVGDEELYKAIYSVYSLDGDMNDSFAVLNKFMKRFAGISWKYKIRGFISRKNNIADSKRNIDVYLSFLNDLIPTPKHVKYIENKESFIHRFRYICPQTTLLYMSIYCNSNYENIHIDTLRHTIYKSVWEMNNKKFDDSIRTLNAAEKLVNSKDYYNLERIYYLKNEVHSMTNNVNEIIDLTVNAFFTNPNLVRRFDLPGNQKSVKLLVSKDYMKKIQYPIYIYISDKSNHKEQRIAYSNYLDMNHINSVEALLDFHQYVNSNMYTFFLSMICTQTILKRDIRLSNNAFEAEEVRIKILNHLIKYDEENKKQYIDEINLITTERVTRERLHHVAQSKIHIDIDKILLDNKDIWRESFNKYVSMKSFDRKVLGFDLESDHSVNIFEKATEIMSSLRTQNLNYNQELLVLKSIIARIIEEYLFNTNYGMETYLSSRIRHGYCKNQLSKLFYDYHLMSMSDNNSGKTFMINEYWDKIAFIESDSYQNVKRCLSEFTLKIDNKISEIKEKWIRINYRNDNNGLFDYSKFVNSCLVLDYDNINDFESFVTSINEVFWSWTETLLNNIRRVIVQNLHEYYLGALNELETAVSKIVDANLQEIVQEIVNSCNQCKPKLEIVVREFADVFCRPSSLYSNFTMDDLVNTCQIIAKSLYPKFDHVKFDKKIGSAIIFSGRYFTYFVDALNILLSNAIEHAGFHDISKLSIAICINEISSDEYYDPLIESGEEYKRQVETSNPNDKYMRLSVRNNLNRSKRGDDALISLKKHFELIASDDYGQKHIQSEGGTGLYKLNKTLKYNIGSKYYIAYETKNNCVDIVISFGINSLMSEGDEQ